VLGKRRVEWVLRLLVADAAVVLASFLGSYWIRVLLNRPLDRAAGPLTHYLWLLGLIVPVWLGLLAFMGGYGVGWTAQSRAWLFIRVSGVGVLLVSAALFLVPGGQQINRSLVALFAAVSGLGLWAERGLAQAWLRRTRPSARWARVALVVGTGVQAGRLVAALRKYPEAGWVVRGCMSMDASDPVGVVEGTPVIASLSELPDVLEADEVVDEVFFAVAPDRLPGLAEALEVCESLGVDTRVLVDLHRPAQAHPFVEELFTLPFYGFSPTLTRQGVLAAKRLLDLVVASILVVATLPLFVVIGLLVKLTSSGPVLFRQERAGFHGRRFRMYKFRTMIHGAEEMREEVAHLNEMTGPVFKAKGDPRFTRVGRLLRRASLDELPQLFNVLKGEMSLVGPRPLPLYEAREIKGAQRRRLAMRPGITGLWQVSGRSMVNFDAWMSMDLRYVDHWSLALDLNILLRTIPVVLRGEGAS
jgi:exopolysaccharide biosynthesis polyprenyl glycosylphosphotransferase